MATEQLQHSPQAAVPPAGASQQPMLPRVGPAGFLAAAAGPAVAASASSVPKGTITAQDLDRMLQQQHISVSQYFEYKSMLNQ